VRVTCVQLLLSRELVVDWLAKLPAGAHSLCSALVKMVPDYVYDLLIFPLLEAHLSHATGTHALDCRSLFSLCTFVAHIFFFARQRRGRRA
jgi:hypothetical protein